MTDVTGFGLLGHAHEMAIRSGVRIELDAAALPALPGALETARAGERTGGDSRNRDFAAAHVESEAADDVLALAYDPQTAGGLLVAVAGRARCRAGGHVRLAGPVPRAASARCATAPASPSSSSYTRVMAVESTRAVRVRARELSPAASPPPRRRDRGGALPDRDLRQPRPAHLLGARLRVVARLRGGLVLPRGEPPRVRRVRQPRLQPVPDRALARALARRLAARPTCLGG